MIRTRVGYTGGTSQNPTYTHLSDHTEAIQIDYDPSRIRYEQLLALFWRAHSPTAKAWSQQYKAAIYYHNEAQKQAALQTRDKEADRRKAKIHTEIVPATRFYRAEDYHQKYRLRRIRELTQELRALYPTEQAFVDSTAAARINGFLGGHGNHAQFEQVLPTLGLSEVGQKLLRGYTPYRKRR